MLAIDDEHDTCMINFSCYHFDEPVLLLLSLLDIEIGQSDLSLIFISLSLVRT